ncbi:lysophospholipid acyltransferase family protein [Rhizobacter sp. P5_C2]
MIRRAWQLACFYLLLLGLGLASLVWSLVAALMLPVVPRRRAQVIGRHVVASSYRVFWNLAAGFGLMEVDSQALDRLNDDASGLVVVANHPSMVDALLIVARLQRGVCIMKGDLMRNVFLGAGARIARYIPNDSPRTMLRHAIENLREGAQLVMFPEGTRTEAGGMLNRFRPGVTAIAHKAGVPIQTVFIETDSPYLRKGWPIWRVPPFPMAFTLRLGERFEPRESAALSLDELESYFRTELCKKERT